MEYVGGKGQQPLTCQQPELSCAAGRRWRPPGWRCRPAWRQSRGAARSAVGTPCCGVAVFRWWGWGCTARVAPADAFRTAVTTAQRHAAAAAHGLQFPPCADTHTLALQHHAPPCQRLRASLRLRTGWLGAVSLLARHGPTQPPQRPPSAHRLGWCCSTTTFERLPVAAPTLALSQGGWGCAMPSRRVCLLPLQGWKAVCAAAAVRYVGTARVVSGWGTRRAQAAVCASGDARLPSVGRAAASQSHPTVVPQRPLRATQSRTGRRALHRRADASIGCRQAGTHAKLAQPAIFRGPQPHPHCF